MIAHDRIVADMRLAPDYAVVADLGERLNVARLQDEAVLADTVGKDGCARADVGDDRKAFGLGREVEQLAVAVHPPPAHRHVEAALARRELPLHFLERHQRQIEKPVCFAPIAGERESDDAMGRILAEIAVRLTRIVAGSEDDDVAHCISSPHLSSKSLSMSLISPAELNIMTSMIERRGMNARPNCR